MKQKYKIYQRGHLYRVGRPRRWFGVKWAHDIGYDDWGVFETEYLSKAIAKRNAENESVELWGGYHKDSWKENDDEM